MFRQRTVLILGAGAGDDIRMPLGSALAHHIIGRVTNPIENNRMHCADEELERAFMSASRMTAGEYYGACNVLRKGLVFARSIDEFMHAHEENQAVQILGKLAIARSIIHFEQESHIYFERAVRHMNYNRYKDSWLPLLFKLMHGGVSKGYESRIFEGLSIINFNYDRCIEHFLFNAIRDYFDLEEAEAAKVMANLDIKHPYGTVGDLLWKEPRLNVPYGMNLDTRLTITAARQLLTYTEEVDDKERLQAVREIIATANTLIFLGFHFHQPNITLLGPMRTANRIYAAAYGRSPDDKNIIKETLVTFMKNSILHDSAIRLIDSTCADAFKQHSLTWSN